MRTFASLLLLAAVAHADGLPITGRILDPEGKPAVGAQFGAEWSNRNGKLVPLQSWKPGADGGFTGELHWVNRPMVLLAMDAARKNGAFQVVEDKDLKSRMDIELKLAPMSDVSGALACPAIGPALGTTTLVVQTRPGGAWVARLTLTDDRFTLPLPPGNYDAVAVAYDARELRTPFRVEAGGKAVDLGKLELEPTVIAKSWGKAPPAFSATAARGIDAGVKLSDLGGKWVLLVFWNAESDDATRAIFPRLTDLLDRRKADAGKFEILAIHDASAKTWEEYDARIAKIMAGPWGGQDLPFPVLLDATGETFKAWGVDAPPKVVLIDPEGHVVRAGDEYMLEQKLDEKK